MRLRTPAAAALLVAFAAITSAQEKLEFTEFVSKDGKYKIQVPGKAMESQKELQIGGKAVVMHTASVSLPSKSEKRAVVLTSLALVEPIAAGGEKAAVEQIAKAAAGKGKVLSEKAMTHGKDKLPGRDCLVENPEHHMRYRAVLSGQRIYQLMVLGPKDFVTSKDADTILDSFEVTK